MCKAPKPPAPPVERRPAFLSNPILDSAEGSSVGQLRIGRSSLRTDLNQERRKANPLTAPQFIPGQTPKPIAAKGPFSLGFQRALAISQSN
jgi:hypothetical protein